MRQTRIAKLTRVKDLQGNTLQFTTPSLKRRPILAFIDPALVPDFEGDEAWFELERVPAKPWAYWKPLRQTEEPRRVRPPQEHLNDVPDHVEPGSSDE